MTETIHTPERITLLTDILTTAVEGGINYWSVCEEYKIWLNPEDRESMEMRDDPFAIILDIVECEGWTDEQCIAEGLAEWEQRSWMGVFRGYGRRYPITINTIETGMRNILLDEKADGLHATMTAALEQNDSCPEGRDVQDIDSSLADEIVQYGLFGKSVYG